jgi:hypothetical protein
VDEAEAQQLVGALRAGEPCAVFTAHLDAVLAWLARPDASSLEPLNAALSASGLPRERAGESAYQLLDAVVLAHDGVWPGHVLGLPEDASPERLRRRYRLMLSVYHPDRHPNRPAFATLRAERINRAYRLVRGPRVDVRARRAWERSRAARAPRHSLVHDNGASAWPPAASRGRLGTSGWGLAPGRWGCASWLQRRLVQAMIAACLVLAALVLFDLR